MIRMNHRRHHLQSIAIFSFLPRARVVHDKSTRGFFASRLCVEQFGAGSLFFFLLLRIRD